jgi:hypothetical protein
MRAINITNEKKRDAEVGLEPLPRVKTVEMVLPDGEKGQHIKLVKTTASLDKLVEEHGDLVSVGQALIAGDPEIDTELVGKFLQKTHKLYLSRNGEIAYRVNLIQVVKAADGTEKERREFSKAQANVDLPELPVQWSGRKFPKDKALRSFVFTRKYQIRHTNGLSYDFLYDMAKELHESKSMMFVGAGKKGNEPLILTTGGEPHRAFLEGRIEGESYCLILHLTNLELKPLITGEEAEA